MTKTKKAEKGEVTVKVSGKIGNGEGGHFRKGSTFVPCDEDAAKSLKAKGLIE